MIIRLLLALVLLLGALPAQASNRPFCVAGPALPPQCLYDDISTCRSSAQPPSSYCIANPQAELRMTGSTEYCAVTAELVALCYYVDRGLCDAQAERSGMLCVDRQSLRDTSGNPYRFDGRVQN